jgi:hypothetical protein
MLAHQFGMLDIERARVRLFFGHSDLGQVLDQHFRFDLEFPREFVNPYLIRVRHSPLFFDSSQLRFRCFFAFLFDDLVLAEPLAGPTLRRRLGGSLLGRFFGRAHIRYVRRFG